MNEFIPDYTVRPCETFRELLLDKEWTLDQFAIETGKNIEYVRKLNDGDLLYSEIETAKLLELVFLIPHSFWINLENNHQEALKRGASIIE